MAFILCPRAGKSASVAQELSLATAGLCWEWGSPHYHVSVSLAVLLVVVLSLIVQVFTQACVLLGMSCSVCRCRFSVYVRGGGSGSFSATVLDPPLSMYSLYRTFIQFRAFDIHSCCCSLLLNSIPLVNVPHFTYPFSFHGFLMVSRFRLSQVNAL